MPVTKCSNGKFKIGSGDCMYDSKEKADKAYKGYIASKQMEEMKYKIKISLEDLDNIDEKLKKAKKNIKKVIKNGSNKRV